MPAAKLNYLVIYENQNQVYGASSEDVALNSPPPAGSTIEDKHIFFVMHEPDQEQLVWYKVPDEKVKLAFEESQKLKETDE